MPDFFERSLMVHEQLHGKIGIVGKMPIANRDDLSLAYTPGVARPCEVIASDQSKARDLTIKRNSVAVVSDGSAVLGLGNIGPYAAIPVMEMLLYTNRLNRAGTLQEILVGADVFIGVSKGNLLSADDVSKMAADSIVLAMANPIPEIMPEDAKRGGAAIVGTGRSDFPNQVNNFLAFPGIFRGALDACASSITEEMKIAAAWSLAAATIDPSPDQILPDPLDRSVAPRVAAAVAEAARSEKP